MADIKIDDIQLTGSELFEDPEGFMDQLNDDEITSVYGGLASGQTNSGTCGCSGQLMAE